jgi:hypothetical protein
MQAIALVTGDEFLVPYNLTIDVALVEFFLYELTWKWNLKLGQNIGFDDFYGVEFMWNLGFSGMCTTFNNVAIEEIFYLEKYST